MKFCCWSSTCISLELCELSTVLVILIYWCSFDWFTLEDQMIVNKLFLFSSMAGRLICCQGDLVLSFSIEWIKIKEKIYDLVSICCGCADLQVVFIRILLLCFFHSFPPVAVLTTTPTRWFRLYWIANVLMRKGLKILLLESQVEKQLVEKKEEDLQHPSSPVNAQGLRINSTIYKLRISWNKKIFLKTDRTERSKVSASVFVFSSLIQ